MFTRIIFQFDIEEKTGLISALLKVVGVIFGAIGLISSATSEAFNLVTLIGLAVVLIIVWKTKAPKGYFKNYFIKNIKAGQIKPLIPATVTAVIGFVTFFICIAG